MLQLPSPWHTLPTGYSNYCLLQRAPTQWGKRSASYDWLTHTSILLLNRLRCTANSGLVLFPSPMGAGDNLTFIEIQLQWVQGGWRSSFYCHRWGEREHGFRTSRLYLSLILSRALVSASLSLTMGELFRGHESILWCIQTWLTTAFNEIGYS